MCDVILSEKTCISIGSYGIFKKKEKYALTSDLSSSVSLPFETVGHSVFQPSIRQTARHQAERQRIFICKKNNLFNNLIFIRMRVRILTAVNV